MSEQQAKPLTADEKCYALKAPFRPESVRWLPRNVSGNRCLAMPYVNARVVMDRLDRVLGVANWQDTYEFLPGGCVKCRLLVRLEGVDGEWIAKEDVGGQSEQPDEGDKVKSAVSEALKRVAVKYGVGRYLYHIPPQWADYDPQKKRMVKEPQLPDWALPAKPAPAVKQPPPAAETKVAEPGISQEDGDRLVKLLHEKKVGRDGFFIAFGIRRLGELTSGQFQEAQRWITERGTQDQAAAVRT